MKIEVLEERMGNIEDTKLSSILGLILDAVRDFPLMGTNDTELYFNEVRKLIGSDEITQSSIDDYLNLSYKEERESDIWIC
ncbi:hypothetical protein [Desertivirga xinjiangensis]|uniref:hypothetical protein n=1 Tax=Desertivirga xinjiangensis TaxID=539206 RepID=UPI00210AC406|nr:hypothetical protein [Pedobacter xinjiangensis]